MIKSYYLYFGYLNPDKNLIARIIADKLNIEFVIGSADTLYHNFNGFKDRISIFDNYLEEDDWWQQPDHRECPILVSCSFTSGKNIEKETKANRVRISLRCIPGLKEIEFKIAESDK